jgi:predicted ATP-dependent serine protease
MTFSWSWLFRCAACGKLHFKWTGRTCPCGEPFPDAVREESLR